MFKLRNHSATTEFYAEITEVFVSKNDKRRKIASEMMVFTETYLMKEYGVHKLEF